METYFTKTEVAKMERSLKNQLKSKDKTIKRLNDKISDLEDKIITLNDTITELKSNNVTEESDSNE